MHLYFAYGLSICSEILLPELIKGINIEIDIEIKKGSSNAFSQIKGKEIYRASEQEVFRIIPNIGAFLIQKGRRIVVHPASGVDDQLFRQYLLGNALGTLFHQRGLLVLHGSAAFVDGGAIAFLGPSGSGKSTFAASLCKKGHAIIADDLMVIDANTGMPLVYPAFPQVNLWPDIAESIGCDLDMLPHVVPEENKRVIRLELGFSLDPLPLKRIYILEKGETIEIQHLSPQESFIELMRNSYAVKSLISGLHLANHFSQCTKVAKDVPICRLLRPFDLKYLNDFAHVVVEDIKKC